MKKLTLLIFLGLGFLLATAQEYNDNDQIKKSGVLTFSF